MAVQWTNESYFALRNALAELDFKEVGRLCNLLAEVVALQVPPIPEVTIGNILKDLRRQRLFDVLQCVANAHVRRVGAAAVAPEVYLQLMQALLDQGRLQEATSELEELKKSLGVETIDGREARGLLGRAYKQAYVNLSFGRSGPRLLQGAIAAYREVYENPQLRADNWWHGINIVACLARAERDGIPAELLGAEHIDWRREAATILGRTSQYTVYDNDYTWAAATAMEACIALEDNDGATKWCERYISAPFAHVFELGSTERQLREVWQLDQRDVPGAEALQVIRGRLGRLGGRLIIDASATSLAARSTLTHQAQLGDEAGSDVGWLEKMCHRADSVALITKEVDQRQSGTGFLVKPRELGLGCDVPLVLLTNWHVVNRAGSGQAMRPDQARAKLMRVAPNRALAVQVLDEFEDLDASILNVELPEPDCSIAKLGIPLGRRGDIRPTHTARPPRLYVIGHPRGGVLTTTLHDNWLIELPESEHFIRYRSPTEPGSSGSPVLSDDLEAIAIHHATRTDIVANQGVLLDAIRERVRSKN